MRKKIEYGLYCLSTQPNYLTPPNVKHFSVERYSSLYEYRARIKQLFRVIFFLDNEGNVILLVPFIKSHDRNTEQALEKAVEIKAGIGGRRLHEYIPHKQ